MKILISGASGMIGNAIIQFLSTAGHHITRLVRNKRDEKSDAIFWNPEKGLLDPASVEGFDAVINLSGENIASGRWNEKRKKTILNSRVQSTQTLAKVLSSLKRPPRVYIAASAIGFYGNRGDEICTENSSSGSGFLAEVCREWESAAAPITDKGIRTVFLRFGIVLSREGGALAKMLPPFKLGLGGIIGPGTQYMSWVHIDDVVAIALFALTHEDIRCPVNVVSPQPVTNAVFIKTLGKVLHRPTVLPVPAFALDLLLGKEMANDFLLGSIRVEPRRLNHAGYSFHFTELNEALKNLMKW